MTYPSWVVVRAGTKRQITSVSLKACCLENWLWDLEQVPSLLWLQFTHLQNEQNNSSWNFPASSVVKALHFHCRKCGFDPWVQELRSCMPHGVPPKTKPNKELNSCDSLYIYGPHPQSLGFHLASVRLAAGEKIRD